MLLKFGRRGISVVFVLAILAAGCGEREEPGGAEHEASTRGESTREAVSERETRITADDRKRFSEDAVVLAVRTTEEPGISANHAAEFDRDLQSIREKYPFLEDTHARPTFVLDEVLVTLSAEADWRERWSAGELETGAAPLDSLLREYGASEVESLSNNSRANSETFLVSFEGPLNTMLLAREMESSSPDIRYAEPNAISGDGDDIEYKRLTDDTESYTFSEGAGDCLAGCIDRRYWTVTVDENGGLSLKKSDDGGEENRRKSPGAPRTFS